MNIILTGASGLLGREVLTKLEESEYKFNIYATAFSRTSGGLTKLNLLEKDDVEEFIKKASPDLIIHTAAERRPDIVKEDPAQAEKLNVSSVETIAKAAEKAGAAVIYISTDYVFDGENPPYFTDSEPNPLNEYGRMKLAGEEIIQKYCSRPIILRIPVLYGEVRRLSESAVTVIAEKLFADKESFHDNDAVRYPTHTKDVAGVISGMAELTAESKKISGIYHWSSETPYTKYTIAKTMAGILNYDQALVKEAPIDPNAAPRPQDAHLDTEATKKLNLGSEKDFKTEISKILSRNYD